jgi:hypothetical protein
MWEGNINMEIREIGCGWNWLMFESNSRLWCQRVETSVIESYSDNRISDLPSED